MPSGRLAKLRRPRLQCLAHVIERDGKFAEFIATGNIDSMPILAAGEGIRGFIENSDGPDDAADDPVGEHARQDAFDGDRNPQPSSYVAEVRERVARPMRNEPSHDHRIEHNQSRDG